MVTTALRVLGMLWCLPVALPIWVLFVLPAWLLLGWLSWDGWAAFGVVRFRVTGRRGWWGRRWEGWGGFTLPYCVMLNTDSFVIELHELRHTDQWLILGPLFPVVYGALFAVHGYHDNPLEMDARVTAHRQAAFMRSIAEGR